MLLEHETPYELYHMTRDKTDYVWYNARVFLEKNGFPVKKNTHPVLNIDSLGHALAAFVNGEFVGFKHGNNVEKFFDFKVPLKNLMVGSNGITILAMVDGFPNSGSYMEKRFAGPRAVLLQVLLTGTLDLTSNTWKHDVGVSGEKDQIFSEEGSKKVLWKGLAEVPAPTPVTWYKTTFDAPEGNGPVAINMDSMAKGMI